MNKIYIKTDTNKVVSAFGIPLNDNHIPLKNGTATETNLDLDNIELINNYKLVDGILVELTNEEKTTLFPTLTPILSVDEKLKLMQKAIDDLVLGGAL